MVYNANNPVIVQSDSTILLEVNNPYFTAARDILGRFAELVKSPEYVYTYRISPLSLWNAAASGMTGEEIISELGIYSKYDIPGNVAANILEQIDRYGRIKLISDDGELHLRSDDSLLITEIWHSASVRPYLEEMCSANSIRVKQHARGHVKQALIRKGLPVEDLAGYVEGTPLHIELVSEAPDGQPFSLRDYQTMAVDTFHAQGGPQGGSGVIVLPCGAGKTIVGLGIMEKLQCETLIVTTNVIAVRQWMNEIFEKTNLTEFDVGEYTGEKKEIRPVTITTYQMLTYRRKKTDEFPHFKLFNENNWGFIIYDEVHLLPAPVFRVTAEIQARRRLGLTATLVREDGHEEDVFSLIGPKKHDVPWKVLEQQGWIAAAECYEVRVKLPEKQRVEYAVAGKRDKFRIASENATKTPLIKELLEKHSNAQVLIIGQYIAQLKDIAEQLRLPLITGSVKNEERQKLYSLFRAGELGALVVSKVANFSVDLPDANVAIQVSGTFGSRQEEAQRLGRILRPSTRHVRSYFYSIVTKETSEQDYAAKRQLFLTEQGYKYHIMEASQLLTERWE